MSQEFQREDRYIIIKRSDLQHAGHHTLSAFHSANHNLRESMSKNGVPDRQFVVIESDWPEYEAVWQMIERRMTGQPSVTASEELQAVLHWRDKHAQAVKERDALQQRMTIADQRVDDLQSTLDGRDEIVGDLSAMVKRLVHHLRKAAPDNDLPDLAVDYLRRKCLAGTPLRESLDASDITHPAQ